MRAAQRVSWLLECTSHIQFSHCGKATYYVRRTRRCMTLLSALSLIVAGAARIIAKGMSCE
ncbi:hypothetical protein B0H13DRAFT_2319375 [Mycena leptocephala]|nr:hypothetical protein B0H13DRAFT_2319375 [Mycena leptocephala]